MFALSVFKEYVRNHISNMFIIIKKIRRDFYGIYIISQLLGIVKENFYGKFINFIT